MGDIREGIIKYELQRELEKARQLEREGRIDQSGRHYMKASALYKRLAKDMPLHESREVFETAAQYEALASTAQKVTKSKPDDEEMPSEVIDSLIITQKPDTKWEDIGGLEEAKSAIKEAIILPFIKHKPSFVKSPRTILLYGPPGTGKTLLAKASSHNLGATFFEARISALLSKYYGESPKLVDALFSKARKMQPSLMFIDELDSIAISRDSDMHETTRRVLSQLLTEIEGFNTKGAERVLVMGATNKPWDLDDAVVSRFQKKVYVPLPDEASRKSILKIHLKGADTGGLDIGTLAGKTDCFSGRDLAALCQEAIMHMVREENPGLESLTSKDVEYYSLNYRPLGEKDFDFAFGKVKPVAGRRDIEKYELWKKDFGG
ncbi:MAG: ATP-binding protein [Candidatus Aenigmarchaeota archaeon]|nr:ATP-binding protein [Candidatus Aenigmarchaeota archaeon]